jgi:IS5 family transposase
VEEATNLNLAIKEFVGLAVDELAPDHSTLSEFNKRLREANGLCAFLARLARPTTSSQPRARLFNTLPFFGS